MHKARCDVDISHILPVTFVYIDHGTEMSAFTSSKSAQAAFAVVDEYNLVHGGFAYLGKHLCWTYSKSLRLKTTCQIYVASNGSIAILFILWYSSSADYVME